MTTATIATAIVLGKKTSETAGEYLHFDTFRCRAFIETKLREPKQQCSRPHISEGFCTAHYKLYLSDSLRYGYFQLNKEKQATTDDTKKAEEKEETDNTPTNHAGRIPPPTKKRSRVFQPDDPFTHTEFVTIHGVDYLLDRSTFYLYEFYAPYTFVGRMNEHGHILKKFQPPNATA